MAHATKEKARAYYAAYREKNRERLKAYRNEWYRDNAEAQREKNRENSAAFAKRHPERVTAANKRFYAKNRDEQIARSKEWYRRNPAKAKAKKRRAATRDYLVYIMRTFGLTAERYHALMGEQNGLCRICRRTNDGKVLHVDHVHVDGYEDFPPILKASLVRGLLCFRCNSGIGSFRDDAETLRAAASYLEGRHG